jgi:hypothetical protein
MKTSSVALMALLASAALLACGEASAQARGKPVESRQGVDTEPEMQRVTALLELDSWLRRLAGKFRISTSTRIIGEANCGVIGVGPGVHCIFRITPSTSNDRWRVQVRMFGLDLTAPGIGYLRLNHDSTAEGGVAKLQGDAIFFNGACPVIQPERAGPVTVTVLDCQQELRMRAPPGKAVRIRNRVQQYVMVIPPRGRPFRRRTSFTEEWQLDPVR